MHSLSNIDYESRVADCTICGPGVPIKVKTIAVSSGTGRRAQCRIKHKEWENWSRRQNPDQWAELRRRQTYGLSPGDYSKMLAEQDGRCAICGQAPEKLYVDHHHETGRVRGLLCYRCNFGIGWLQDDPEVALSASRYLATR